MVDMDAARCMRPKCRLFGGKSKDKRHIPQRIIMSCVTIPDESFILEVTMAPHA